MAIQTGFSLLHGFSGRLGNQVVIKRWGNKTILAAMPRKSNKPPTEKQKEVQRRFKLAAAYAKRVSNDPELRVKYPVTKGKTVYRQAFTDYLSNPSFYESKNIPRCPFLRCV